LRIPLVCVGTQAARNALPADDQLVRRFEAFALRPWRNADDFAALIGGLIRSLPRRRESVFCGLALQRLVEATGGVTAALFAVVTRLAVAAITSGEKRIDGATVEGRRAAAPPIGEPV
jgi:Bacterial TniB protein